ncbi:MAG: hypothetical protein AAF394_13125, partial [Planctomycetota bacterium]
EVVVGTGVLGSLLNKLFDSESRHLFDFRGLMKFQDDSKLGQDFSTLSKLPCPYLQLRVQRHKKG